MPRSSALPEKYAQTLCSIEAGISTFAVGGMWWRPRTPFPKSISDGMSFSSIGLVLISPPDAVGTLNEVQRASLDCAQAKARATKANRARWVGHASACPSRVLHEHLLRRLLRIPLHHRHAREDDEHRERLA